MNIIWSITIIISIILMLFSAPADIFQTLISGASNALTLAVKLWAIYAVWLGVLKIIEETNLDKKISKLFNPILRFLFGRQDPYTYDVLSINLTSNILGLGNACVPSGIESISRLDKGSKYLTSAMAMLVLINTFPVQLFPSTIVGLMISHGSKNASVIVLPIILLSLTMSIVGITLIKILSKIFKDKV